MQEVNGRGDKEGDVGEGYRRRENEEEGDAGGGGRRVLDEDPPILLTYAHTL